jgi:hypothetical protein
MVLYMEGHLHHLRERMKAHHEHQAELGPPTRTDLEELETVKSIATSLQWISRDPEGFKAFCVRLSKKWGPLNPPKRAKPEPDDDQAPPPTEAAS